MLTLSYQHQQYTILINNVNNVYLFTRGSELFKGQKSPFRELVEHVNNSFKKGRKRAGKKGVKLLEFTPKGGVVSPLLQIRYHEQLAHTPPPQ